MKYQWHKNHMKLACTSLGIHEPEILDVTGVRWTLSYEQNPNFPDFSTHMLKLERVLQDLTKRPIDLRLESESDKNKRVERSRRGSKLISD